MGPHGHTAQVMLGAVTIPRLHSLCCGTQLWEGGDVLRSPPQISHSQWHTQEYKVGSIDLSTEIMLAANSTRTNIPPIIHTNSTI